MSRSQDKEHEAEENGAGDRERAMTANQIRGTNDILKYVKSYTRGVISVRGR
jgi:hypothetical protein